VPDIGPLPEPLNSSPVDFAKYWSILDQTKAEFKASGRSGVVILIDAETAYHEKLKKFLIPFKTNWEYNSMKPQLVIQHDTQAKELYDKIIAAGLRAELIIAEKEPEKK
jgi:hypothetical protein